MDLIFFIEEFECTGAAIADLAARFGGALADSQYRTGRDARRARFLDDFLMAALHRAIALEQVDRVLVLVGKHLDLDMARIGEKLFEVDGRVAERGLRLGLG